MTGEKGKMGSKILEGEAVLPQVDRTLRVRSDRACRQIDLDPERVAQGLAGLVLGLLDLLRRLLERQAIRRVQGGDLTEEEEERLGVAFMALEEKMGELIEAFGLAPEDLNLDLGPLGRLWEE